MPLMFQGKISLEGDGDRLIKLSEIFGIRYFLVLVPLTIKNISVGDQRYYVCDATINMNQPNSARDESLKPV